jgi:hypothetical protein
LPKHVLWRSLWLLPDPLPAPNLPILYHHPT